MRIIALAYHSQNINGDQYENNDHIALREDLSEIRRRKIPLVSLKDLCCNFQSRASRHDLPEIAVALSCDDGTTLDWENFSHPHHGQQISFAEILREHMLITHDERSHLLTSFVIASPTARKQIDAGCHAGYELSIEKWWKSAAMTGLIAIENHSWDHLHPCIDVVSQRENKKGDFSLIDSYDDADKQVRQAAEYINKALGTTGHRTSLFAYPFGHFNDYLTNEYLPKYRHQHEMLAAFTTQPEVITEASNIFKLPRYVHGEAWTTPNELVKILNQLQKNY